MTPQKPLRRDDVKARKLGNEWMLYDDRSGSVHIINETAAKVWEMCDGTRTVEEIAAALAEQYETPPEANVPQDVADVIASFAGKDVLQSSPE